MSSSQAFTSSPLSPTTQRQRRSRFTYKHLSTLSQCATNCPLRVIAHIDLDAFYAQCEMVRLGVPATQPLAVQQWQGLIAINYPARAYGLSRHVPITEAKEKCPELICQHVATWKEGDAAWSYAGEAWKEMATRKVSLDPYRLQSRRILALIKAALPAAPLQRVEKASIDEVFLDLSAQAHALLLDRYPALRAPPPYDDPSEPLPRPPTTALDWAADALVDLDCEQSEEDDPDWDDVVMLLASEVVRDVRKRIFDELQYTCSAGIGRNKMLAKLGSGHKKPNSQTVVRNRAVQQFLSGFKFTKIRNLGGKFGDEVVAAFNTDVVSDLLPVPIERMRKQFGDETGAWLYGVLRGEDYNEVNPRTQIKSMLSAKSFRPSINSMDAACKWLRIFVADIHGRLVEEGVLENKRRPKTMNLHHRQGQQSRSKQAPIPLGKTINEEILFELAKNLMAQVIVDGRAWPCSNLSLSVGGFEDGVTGNRGIGSFLVRGEEAKSLFTDSREGSLDPPLRNPRPSKKRRIRVGGIPTLFGAQQRTESPGAEADKDDNSDSIPVQDSGNQNGSDDPEQRRDDHDQWLDEEDELHEHEHDYQDDDGGALPPSAQRTADSTTSTAQIRQQTPQGRSPHSASATFTCDRCGQQTPVVDQAEHNDFHFAQDLQNQQSSPPRPPPKPATPAQSKGKAKGRGRPTQALGPEKGQKRLAFG